jgi:hypothetical protein
VMLTESAIKRLIEPDEVADLVAWLAGTTVGSSNDYCGVYKDGADADGAPLPLGPIWLGYYRSENGARRSSRRWFRGTRATPRRTEPGPRCGRQAPETPSWPGTETAGCSPDPRAPTTRRERRRRSTTNGSPPLRTRPVSAARRSATARSSAARSSSTAAPPHRTSSASSTTRPRSRPTGRATRPRAAICTSPGPGSPATVVRTSMWSAPPTTAPPSPGPCC